MLLLYHCTDFFSKWFSFKFQRSSYYEPYFLTTKLLVSTLFILSIPTFIHAQTPALFAPRHSAGSIIVNNTLYIVAGSTSIKSTQLSAETFSLSLISSFDISNASNIPWNKLAGSFQSGEAQLTATADEQYLVLTGISDRNYLMSFYNIISDNWSNLSPGSSTGLTPRPDRTSVGITIDPISRNIIFYGGLLSTYTNSTVSSPSAELDILDTRLSSPFQWVWNSVHTTAFPLPALVRPIMLYVPYLNGTLVIGGCSSINSTDGAIQSCEPFTGGYVVGTQTAFPQGSLPAIDKITFDGIPPTARYAPCVALLDDENIFMYGGATSSGSLDDTWVLDVKNRVWNRIQKMTGDAGGRAGATCQLASPSQIIMVGGFTGGYLQPISFSKNQVVVINTKTWAWLTSFTPGQNSDDPNDNNNNNLSIPAVIGVAAGACIATGLVGLFIGNIFWRHWKKRRHDQFMNGMNGYKDNHSNELLMNTDDQSTDNSKVSHVLMDPSRNSSKISTSSSTSPLNNNNYNSNNNDSNSTSPNTLFLSINKEPNYPLPPKLTSKEKERPGFIIFPYPPSEMSDSIDTRTTTAFDSIEMSSVYSGGSSNHNSKNTRPKDSTKLESESSVPTLIKGSQLPHNLADIQQGVYHKTLQHQKHYNNKKLRDYGLGTGRMGTHDSFLAQNINNNEEEGSELSTGVIALADIDVGEEPAKGIYSPGEDGMLLLSSPLETSYLDSFQQDRRSIIRY